MSILYYLLISYTSGEKKGVVLQRAPAYKTFNLQLALVNDVLLCEVNCALTLFDCLPCCAWFFDFSCNVLLCLLLSLYSEVAVRYELPVCCVSRFQFLQQ